MQSSESYQSDKLESPEKSLGSDSDNQDNEAYRNSKYWSLPENVRHAIDLTKKKQKHSDFYTRLRSLNEKISVY